MSIRQINTTYVKEEDRVMLRMSTQAGEEYRLWLTRAVVHELLVQLRAMAVQLVARQGHVQQAQAVADFRQQALAEGTRYTRFEGAPRLPLGAEPVLAYAVQAQVSQDKASLALVLRAGRKLNLRVDEQLVGKLRLLLERMNDQAGWALPLDAPPAAPVQDGGAASTQDTSTPPKLLH